MMVLAVSMIERVTPYSKGQYHHTHFEKDIVNDVDPKQWEGGQKKWQ